MTALLSAAANVRAFNTARLSGYSAANSTTTTRTGSRIGLNQNTSLASIQRLGMSFTADLVAKDNPLCAAYLALRQNYCSSTLQYLPATPDEGLNAAITEYLHGGDGCGGVFSTMGVDCSMQDAFMRTADLECPVKGDSAMILWRANPDDELRLLEVSADQIGELYNFTTERRCSLTRDADGRIRECAGSDCVYFAGRYFRGADCVAYKIYPRSDQWYGTPTIYDAADVLYFRDPASFRGVRGVTLFHAALPYMQKSDDLLSAALGIAQRQARDAYFISNNSGGPPDEPDQEVADSTTGRIVHYETIAEGPIERYRYNGDTITPNAPTAPGTDVIDGVSAAAQMVALALRVTYGFLVEGSKLGGVTSRGDTQKNWKEFSRIQRMIHRPNLNRIKDVKLLDAHRRGLLTIPHGMTTAQFLHGRWMLPTSPVTDAFNDAKENVDMVREGLESPQDIIAETNRDWRDVIRKSGEWREAVEREAAARTKALKADGIEAVVSGQEISATSDNPMQAAQADAQGQPAPGAEKPASGAPVKATAAMAGWEESKHPRADDGKFGEGSGVAKKEESETSKWVREGHSEQDKHADEMRKRPQPEQSPGMWMMDRAKELAIEKGMSPQESMQEHREGLKQMAISGARYAISKNQPVHSDYGDAPYNLKIPKGWEQTGDTWKPAAKPAPEPAKADKPASEAGGKGGDAKLIEAHENEYGPLPSRYRKKLLDILGREPEARKSALTVLALKAFPSSPSQKLIQDLRTAGQADRRNSVA